MRVRLPPMTVTEAGLVLLGIVTFLIAAFILWGGRWGWRRGDGESPVFSFPGLGTVSEPTRLLAGYVGMVLAYHMVVWALPIGVTPVQFPRNYWWLVVLIGSGAIIGSVALDASERREATSVGGGTGGDEVEREE